MVVVCVKDFNLVNIDTNSLMISFRTCKKTFLKSYVITLVKNTYKYKIPSIEILSMILGKSTIA